MLTKTIYLNEPAPLAQPSDVRGDDLNKYKLPLLVVCFGIISAIFLFVLTLNINTQQLEKDFASDSRLRISTFRDWLYLNVNEVEKLSHFLGNAPTSEEESLFHTLVNHTIERDVFSGIYLVKLHGESPNNATLVSAVTRRSEFSGLLAQKEIKQEIAASILSQQPAATGAIAFDGDKEKNAEIAIIYPIVRSAKVEGAVIALLNPGKRFEAINNDENFNNAKEYIFDDLPDGTEKIVYGRPDEFTHIASMRHAAKISEVIKSTAAFSYDKSLHLFSRQWQIVFIPTSKYMAGANTFAPWAVMSASLLLTVLAGAFLFHLIGQKVLIEKTVRERTLELLYTSNQLKIRGEDLKAAKETAEAASKAKSDFLANISHEIRTPLSSMIGIADLVMETDLTLQQESNIRTILNSGELLLELINDMLDFSKIEAGKLELDPVPFDLISAIEDTMDLFTPKAMDKEKHLELLVRFMPDVPRHVIGDVTRVRQILTNLVNNAIKFTHEGYVLTTVEKVEEPTPEDKVKLRISVEDTGIGIPQDKLNIIFEKFTQADASTTRKFGGTGLGLSICRQLAKMMQGDVTATSVNGKGSTFSFTITLKQDKTVQVAPQPSPSSDLSLLLGKKALVVDDIEASRIILEDHLASAGIVSTSTDNFQSAIVMLANAGKAGMPYDLLVTDYLMSDMQSESFTRHAKSLCPNLIVVIVTSLTEKGYAQIFASSGCDAYLTKPVRKSQFINTLQTLFSAEHYSQNTSMIMPETTFRKRETLTAKDDDSFLRNAEILLVEDNKPNSELGTKLLENFACKVTTVNNGEEAVAIVKQKHFDLILMDCQMPEMDGFEASSIIRTMKQQGEIPDIPIIALTANAMQGDRKKCLEAGMNGYLTKPLRKAALRSTLIEWLPPIDKRTAANNAA